MHESLKNRGPHAKWAIIHLLAPMLYASIQVFYSSQVEPQKSLSVESEGME